MSDQEALAGMAPTIRQTLANLGVEIDAAKSHLDSLVQCQGQLEGRLAESEKALQDLKKPAAKKRPAGKLAARTTKK